jgi:hypothetical protein
MRCRGLSEALGADDVLAVEALAHGDAGLAGERALLRWIDRVERVEEICQSQVDKPVE